MENQVIYRIPTKVKHLELKKRIVRANVDRSKPIDPDKPMPTAGAIVETENLGWYVHFEGSYESLCVGMEEPLNLKPGTEVDIMIVPRSKG